MESFEPVEFADIRPQDWIRFLAKHADAEGSYWRTGKVISVCVPSVGHGHH